MSGKRLLLLGCFFFVIGFLFLMLHRNWIIVHVAYFPFAKTTTLNSANLSSTYNKQITIAYHKNNAWFQEASTIVWHDRDAAQTLKQLIKQWLSVLQDAHLLRSHIAVSTVAVAQGSSEAYISFDTPLFTKELSIRDKWLVIESLCKTIRDSDIPVQSIALLLQEQIMPDDHVDFSHPLSLESRL